MACSLLPSLPSALRVFLFCSSSLLSIPNSTKRASARLACFSGSRAVPDINANSIITKVAAESSGGGCASVRGKAKKYCQEKTRETRGKEWLGAVVIRLKKMQTKSG